LVSPSARDNLRTYLWYSGSIHAAGVVLLFIFLRPALNNADKSTMYSVDFIGSQEQTLAAAPASSKMAVVKEEEAPPAPQPAAQPQPVAPPVAAKPQTDDITLSGKKHKLTPPSLLLPKPSILAHLPKPTALSAAPAEQQQAAPQAQQTAAATAGQSASTGVSADFPNFPYPWYISRVRAALWNEWSSRMPHGGMMSAVVTFKIARDGAAQNITIEKSSSNKLFDYAAQVSAEEAGPFPPLPPDYRQAQLTVHVEFKTTQ
jgi:TonB family protein